MSPFPPKDEFVLFDVTVSPEATGLGTRQTSDFNGHGTTMQDVKLYLLYNPQYTRSRVLGRQVVPGQVLRPAARERILEVHDLNPPGIHLRHHRAGVC